MIHSSLVRSDRYVSLHPGLGPALAFLRQARWHEWSLGKHSLDGERLFVLVTRDAGRGHEGAPLEFHRKYIDVQYVVEGADHIGWRPAEECRRVRDEYDAARDVGFFADPPSTWLDVGAGSLAIFFPEDAHAPLAGAPSERPLKAVVKVAASW